MTHARTKILNAVAAALAATRMQVCKTRVYSRDESELPSVSIFFDGEEIQPATLRAGQRFLRRVATLKIECHAMDSDAVELRLDELAAQVEVEMAKALMVGSIEIPKTFTATAMNTSSTEQQIGEMTLTYKLFYATSENSPDILL